MMSNRLVIAALLSALWSGSALAGEPSDSAPELTVGPRFLDAAEAPGETEPAVPLFDLNLGRETLWLDFTESPADQRAFSPPDAIVDIYPFDSPLRFTGGMIYDGSPVGPGSRDSLSSLPFTPSAGLSPGSIDWGQYTPYAGVGLQSSFLKGRLEFALDFGLSYEGSVDVDPTGPSDSGGEPAELGRAGEARQDGEEPLNLLGFSPRAGLSLRLRF